MEELSMEEMDLAAGGFGWGPIIVAVVSAIGAMAAAWLSSGGGSGDETRASGDLDGMKIRCQAGQELHMDSRAGTADCVNP